MDRSQALLEAARILSEQLESLTFAPPVTYVYDPLVYAHAGYEAYVRLAARTSKHVLFLGMNPGPFGMAQTGVPFGDPVMAREWLGLEVEVGHPAQEHPLRRIEGWRSRRREVSGTRLWGAARRYYQTPERFFAWAFVANYCPLVFMEESGRNRTPDKLPPRERQPLYEACDAHLARVVAALDPAWVIGVGAFAEARARQALAGRDLQFGRILHPSPASPASNAGWDEQASAQLAALGLCHRSGGCEA